MVRTDMPKRIGIQTFSNSGRAVKKTRTITAKAAALVATDMKSCDGGWCALIDIRSPRVKRYQRNFKRQSTKHQPHPDINQGVFGIGVFVNELSYHFEFGCAATCINQGHAINQNGGSKCAGQQVFNCRLLRGKSCPSLVLYWY